MPLDDIPMGDDPTQTPDPGLTPEQLSERPSLDGGVGTGTGADAGLDAPASAPDQAAQAQTIRDAAAAYGYDLSGQPDDHAAFVHLIHQAQAARQNDYYTQLGRQLAPRYRDIQGYLEAQRQKAAPAAAPKPYESPEFDERWLALVERDEQTGAFKARPGVNPEFAEKVQKYADWMQGFNRNPMALIMQAIEDRGSEVARRIVAEQAQSSERSQTVRSIIDQNAGWIYQADAQGRRLTDAQGQFLPTPEGASYVQHLRALQSGGLRDPATQDRIARQLVSAELWQAQAARQQQAQQAQAPQARAAVGRPPVNPGQGVQPGRRGVVPGATEPSGEGLSLADMLRAEMDREGITDADFASA